MMQTFSISEAIKFGWDVFKKHPWFLIGIFIVSNFINFLPNLVTGSFRSLDNTLLLVLLGILFWVINFLVWIGQIMISLKLVTHKKAEFSDLFTGYHYLLSFFLCFVLVILILFVPFIIPLVLSWLSQVVPNFSGAVFYIPLILTLIIATVAFVVILVTIQFSFYFVIDKKLNPIDALKESKKITTGVKLKLFFFWILLILLRLGGLAFFVVGVFITDAISLIASAYVYKKLSGTTSAK